MSSPSVWNKTKGLIKRQITGPPTDPRILKALRESNAQAREATAEAKKANAEAKKQTELLAKIRWELGEQRKHFEGIQAYISADLYEDIRTFAEAQQMGMEETLRRVGTERLSLARYGDGELKLMLRPQYKLRFQQWSAPLAADLWKVLAMDGYDPDRLLVCLPEFQRGAHWTPVWLDLWTDMKRVINPSVQYGTANVSRPLFFERHRERATEMWRSVWDGQDICVITGEGSRFDLQPELFDNAKSIEFIHSKPVDAYSDLPRLYAELEKQDPDKLYLIALGPSGTLIAAWLSQRGRWGVDVGHISVSWANVFAGGAWPESMDVVRK